MPMQSKKKSEHKAGAFLNTYLNGNECGDKCTNLYKEFTTTSSPCPSSIFNPLLTVFSESKKAWSQVSTDDADLKKELEQIQSISDANAAIVDKVVNSNGYSKFCPHVIKLLFQAYTTMKFDHPTGKKDENSKEGEAQGHDINNGQSGFGQSGNQGFGLRTRGQGYGVRGRLGSSFGQGGKQGSGSGHSFGEGSGHGNNHPFGKQGVNQGHGQGGNKGSGSGHSFGEGSGHGNNHAFGKQGLNQGHGQGVNQGSGSGLNQGFRKGSNHVYRTNDFGSGENPEIGSGTGHGFGQGGNRGFGNEHGSNNGLGGHGGNQGLGNGFKQRFGPGSNNGFGGESSGQGGNVDIGSGAIPAFGKQGFGQGSNWGGESNGHNLTTLFDQLNSHVSNTSSEFNSPEAKSNFSSLLEQFSQRLGYNNGSINHADLQNIFNSLGNTSVNITHVLGHALKQEKGDASGQSSGEGMHQMFGSGTGQRQQGSGHGQGSGYGPGSSQSFGQGMGQSSGSFPKGRQAQGPGSGRAGKGKGSTGQGQKTRRKRHSVANHNQDDDETGNGNPAKKTGSKGDKDRKGRHQLFPFGHWSWGLPDLGFFSGNPRCEKASKSCSASSLIESWYADCICPWVWNGKSTKCPVGDELSATVSKASVHYLKRHLRFPKLDGAFEIIKNFTASIRDGPVELSDVEVLLKSFAELMNQESNTSVAVLMKNYLQNLSPEFKQSLVNLVKEIQGGTIRDI